MTTYLNLCRASITTKNTKLNYFLRLKNQEPALSGAFVEMCTPSMLTRQLENCQNLKESHGIIFHFCLCDCDNSFTIRIFQIASQVSGIILLIADLLMQFALMIWK